MFSRCLSNGTEVPHSLPLARNAFFGLVQSFAVTDCITALLNGTVACAEEPISDITAPAADAFKVAHGTALLLSGDATLTTCHGTSTNGASGVQFDRSPSSRPLEFNTPAVFNAALNCRFNWEGNFSALQDHAYSQICNPNVTGGEIDMMVQILGSAPVNRSLVEGTYGGPLDAQNLVDTLAAYQTSLILVNSPFDRWLAGDNNDLTEENKRGYRRFKEIGCATCHQGRNGSDNLYQRHGIFHPPASHQLARVLVPSLRTVYDTPPYFHDGSAETLDQAIRAMGLAKLDIVLNEGDARNIEALLALVMGTYEGKSLRYATP